MTSTSPNDRDKADDDALLDLSARLGLIVADWYARVPGCSCDERSLCAHHTQVAEHIQEARRKLEQAARCATQEE